MTWTPTTTRLPDSDETVLVWDGTDVIAAYWDVDEWFDSTGMPFDRSVGTHWMPMPEPPEAARAAGE